jgi:hypothetical protein
MCLHVCEQPVVPNDDGLATLEECNELVGRQIEVDGTWFGEAWANDHNAVGKKFTGKVEKTVQRGAKGKKQYGVQLIFEDKTKVKMFNLASGVQTFLI